MNKLYGEEGFKFKNTTEFYKQAKTSPETFFLSFDESDRQGRKPKQLKKRSLGRWGQVIKYKLNVSKVL